MADASRSPDAGGGPDRGSTAPYPGTPRWVKRSAIIALVLVLLVVGVMVASGGQHGPGRHLPMPSGAPGDHPWRTAQAVLPAQPA
jgi:hypothetical protein